MCVGGSPGDGYGLAHPDYLGSQVGLVIKNSPANAGDIRVVDSIPGLGRSPGGGHGNPHHYSCLENPHGQRSLVGYSPWGCKVGHDWATNNYTFTPNVLSAPCYICRLKLKNTHICCKSGFSVGSTVKNRPVNAGNVGSIPGSGRFHEGGNGYPLWYSCLENSMDRGAWWATDCKNSTTTT